MLDQDFRQPSIYSRRLDVIFLDPASFLSNRVPAYGPCCAIIGVHPSDLPIDHSGRFYEIRT